MSRPPKEPDVVWVCKCGNRVRIPARLVHTNSHPPSCMGPPDRRHPAKKMHSDHALEVMP